MSPAAPFETDRPIVFFDLEATGVAPAEDRIVEIALIKRRPDGREESFSSLVDPEMPIPPEAVAIHRITDQMVSGQPTFRALAPRVAEFIGDAHLAGFGLVRYDIPMLTAEFKRAACPFSLEGRQVLDAMMIFHRMEPRSLSAAVKFYCGRSHDEAHRAEADARASAAVFWAQLERYPELPRDPQGLAAFCSKRDPRSVDPDGKLVWRNGKASFNFGKYRTLPLEVVVRMEPDYVQWLSTAVNTGPELARICREALRGKFPVQPAA